MNTTKLPEDVVQNIINESKYPVIFRNVLRNRKGDNMWKLLDWSLEELSEKFGDTKLAFRIGINAKTPCPQWEYACETKYMTMKEFIEESKSSDDSKWYYFDYKYMREWFQQKHEIMESIDWRIFGFDKFGEDSTMWLGSKGAHTNCHQDSYGCNLVAQIHGRKQWILYPPNTECLNQTRIPYEESTIYSNMNFFSLSPSDIGSLKMSRTKPRVVTLNPGDVLFVPHGWWHYVESLDLSFSVNMWLPMENDCCDRLGEALIKLVVNRIADHAPIAKDEPQYNLAECLNFIKLSLEECKEKANGKPFLTRSNRESESKCLLENIILKYKNHVNVVNELSMLELEQFLDENQNRFTNDSNESSKPETRNETDSKDLENAVINAFCYSEVIDKVIELVTRELFKKLEK